MNSRIISQIEKLNELYTYAPSHYYKLNDFDNQIAYVKDIEYIYTILNNIFDNAKISEIITKINNYLISNKMSYKTNECVLIMYLMSKKMWNNQLPIYELKHYLGGDLQCPACDISIIINTSILVSFFPCMAQFPEIPIFFRITPSMFKSNFGNNITGEKLFMYFSKMAHDNIQTFSFFSTIIPQNRSVIGTCVSETNKTELINKLHDTYPYNISNMLIIDHFIYTIITKIGLDNFELGYSSMNLLDSSSKQQFITDIANNYIGNYVM